MQPRTLSLVAVHGSYPLRLPGYIKQAPLDFNFALMFTPSQFIRTGCGHGLHAHADYVSVVDRRHPETQHVAYVQQVCIPVPLGLFDAFIRAHVVDTCGTTLHLRDPAL